MDRIAHSTAVATLIAVAFHASLASLAATGAAIEGTVQTPCDPSRVGDVALVQIRSVSGGAITTLSVDPSTGAFLASDLAEGEYDLIALGLDGQPLTPEPKKLLLTTGLNQVFLSLQPPGCGEPDPDAKPGNEQPGRNNGLAAWKLTLIYVGVVGAIVLAADIDADEDPASPSQP